MKHIVKLTVSNPSHDFISMRSRIKQQDYITEARNESEAINRAARHFRTLGFKVHSAVIVEQKVELPEPVALAEAVDYKALEKPTIARIKSGETKPVDRTDYNVPPGMREPIDKKAALEAFIARRKETVTEEAAPQYIEEKLTAADPASKWIHDFVHSDNPKFRGKSKEERIRMALGAKYAAQRNEEVEQGRGRLMNSHVAYLRPKKSAPSDVKDHFEVPVNSDSKKGAHGKFAKIFGSSMAKHYEVVHVKPTVAEEVEQIDEMDKSEPAEGRDSDIPFPKLKSKPIKLTKDKRRQASDMTNQLTTLSKSLVKTYKEEVEQIDEESMNDKVEKHNTRVSELHRQPRFALGDWDDSDLFQKAPKGYRFHMSGHLIPSSKSGWPIRNKKKAIGGVKEEVEQIDEKTHLEYTGKVNDNDYRLLVPHNKDLGDYSDEQLHRKLRRENPHLAHHEVTAIVHSYGDHETDVDVEHKGKKYTHHVVNDQEPNYIREEVEQTDEARKMSRIEWRTGTPGDVAKNHQKIYKKLLSTDPEKAERFLKNVKGMKKEVQANEAADPGETKVVNKVVKTKTAADRIVKIAKSKVNKVNMDPELNHDVKQSSRY